MVQFVVVMVGLRLALGEVYLAHRFKVFQVTVSKMFVTWINLMYYKLQQLPVQLS